MSGEFSFPARLTSVITTSLQSVQMEADHKLSVPSDPTAKFNCLHILNIWVIDTYISVDVKVCVCPKI